MRTEDSLVVCVFCCLPLLLELGTRNLEATKGLPGLETLCSRKGRPHLARAGERVAGG